MYNYHTESQLTIRIHCRKKRGEWWNLLQTLKNPQQLSLVKKKRITTKANSFTGNAILWLYCTYHAIMHTAYLSAEMWLYIYIDPQKSQTLQISHLYVMDQYVCRVCSLSHPLLIVHQSKDTRHPALPSNFRVLRFVWGHLWHTAPMISVSVSCRWQLVMNFLYKTLHHDVGKGSSEATSQRPPSCRAICLCRSHIPSDQTGRSQIPSEVSFSNFIPF